MNQLPLQFLALPVAEVFDANAECLFDHVGKGAIIGLRKCLDRAKDFWVNASRQANFLFRFWQGLPRHDRKCNGCTGHLNPSYNIFLLDMVYLFPVTCQSSNPPLWCVTSSAASNRESWMDSVGQMFRTNKRQSASGLASDFSSDSQKRRFQVGVTGFEPATSWSRTKSVADYGTSKTQFRCQHRDTPTHSLRNKTALVTPDNSRNGIHGCQGGAK